MLRTKRKPLPAFYSFAETESQGRRPLCGLHAGKYAPNVFNDLFGLYLDAVGEERLGGLSKVSGFVLRGESKATAQTGAAEELVRLALNGVILVGLLYKRNPELCRAVARTLAAWPVSADLTERSWQRKAERTIEDLKLGSAVEGYARAARTSAENPIRKYAYLIYETLYQTRWRYKESEARKYAREGCPAWAAKTLALPPFTKPNLRAWASLGKEMLLEQRANFLEDELLKEQKFKWVRRAENRSRRGKPTLRAVQNEAFDDFDKELRQLAPQENLFRDEW